MHLSIISNDNRSRSEIEKIALLKVLINSVYPALLYFTKNITTDEKMPMHVVEEVIMSIYQETRNLRTMDSEELNQKVANAYFKICQSIFPVADFREWNSKIEYWICRAEILRNCHDSLLDLPKFCRKLRYLEFIEKMKIAKAPEK